MHEITILSGKGGTGKTTITAALAALAKSAITCDNDVDAADLFLLLRPDIIEEGTFTSGWTAKIDTDACTQCGLCADLCRFNAIAQSTGNTYSINPITCEGCRLCERICPEKAITSVPNTGNKWFVSDTCQGQFIHAQMAPGEENSGKLVTFIRQKAKEAAKLQNARFILSDGPPGIGCPVIASLTGTKQVLLVIEPSQSGWHDAQRLIELINSFNIPLAAVINKAGINQEMDRLIELQLSAVGITLLAKIPFSKTMREAMLAQMTIIEYAPESKEAMLIRTIWQSLKQQQEAFQTI